MMRHTSLLILTATLTMLVACDEKDTPPSEVEDHLISTPSEQAEEEIAEKAAENVEKLVFAFQPQENPEALTPNAKKLAEYLGTKTGIKSEVFMPTSYAAVVEALRSKNADVAYFSGWPYLIAHNTANVELLVAEERDGNPFYYSQWYVLKDSPIKSLADLKGKPIAFTSPSSTSGYLFPLAKVIEEGHMKTGQDPKEFFGEVLFAGGYQAALKSLVEGKVEAAAASDYAFERYLTEDERAKVRVLIKQGPAPTHGIAVRKDLPQNVKDSIKAALLSLNEDENKELLKSVYGASKLVEREHTEHVQALDKALKLVGAEYPLDKK